MQATDTHAHVFEGELRFATPRRFTPDYEAPLAAYLGHLDANGLARGWLIQPSFLGRDNSVMLAAVARAPARLKAVVVVDPGASAAELSALEAQGAIGARLNLIGLPLPDLRSEPYSGFLARLREREWHLEIHREARDLQMLLPPLLDAGVRVVIDHFGRPDPTLGCEDVGFRYLLTAGPTQRVWVKISAAYRNGNEELARTAARRLLDHFGPQRLLWGSDWPHTQHERSCEYAATLAALTDWVPDEGSRKAILDDSPRALELPGRPQ